MKSLSAICFALIVTSSAAVFAQTPVNPKDVRKGMQTPVLQRDQSAQQQYMRIMQAEDERATTQELIKALDSAHAGVRRRAAVALGRIGEKAALGPLSEKLIDDSNPKVRELAAFGLGETEDPKANRVLLSVLLNKGESIEVRARAAEALGKIAASPENVKTLGEETVNRIINVLTNQLPKPAGDLKLGDAPLVLYSLTALLRIHSADSIGPVSAQLSSPDDQVRFTAANSLSRIIAANPGKAGKEAINAAIAALKDQNPLVRAAAVRALGAAKDSSSTEPLISLLDDANEQVQANAVRALGAIEAKPAAAALVNLGNRLLNRYRASKEPLGPELNLLYLISTALGQIKDKDSLPLLKSLRVLPNGTIGSNIETEIAIAAFDAEAFFSYDSTANLKPGDWQSAANFASGLGEIGGEKALKTLDELLSGKIAGRLDVRALPEVLRAMAKAKHPNLFSILREQIAQSGDEIVRATAAELLGESKAEEDFNALFAAYEKTGKDHLNDAKLAILASVAKMKRSETTNLLSSALKDPDYVVRKQAAELLRMTGSGNFDSKIGPVKTGRERSFYKDALTLSSRTKKLIVQLATSKGVIAIELYPEDAPLTVMNFIALVRSGYFNNINFHRVVPNFVVQGGDPRGDGNGGPGRQIRCEINPRPYIRGSVGMALSGKDTGGSQFFICHSPQPHLDGGYTVFGQVIEGMDVVDKIIRGDRIEKAIVEE